MKRLEEQADILAAVAQAAALSGGWATPRQVRCHLNGSLSLAAVERKLGKLAARGKVVRAKHERRVRYRLPLSQPSTKE
jgi:hypothetical protein